MNVSRLLAATMVAGAGSPPEQATASVRTAHGSRGLAKLSKRLAARRRAAREAMAHAPRHADPAR